MNMLSTSLSIAGTVPLIHHHVMQLVLVPLSYLGEKSLSARLAKSTAEGLLQNS